jgi:hypothetical protein
VGTLKVWDANHCTRTHMNVFGDTLQIDVVKDAVRDAHAETSLDTRGQGIHQGDRCTYALMIVVFSVLFAGLGCSDGSAGHC